MAVLSRMFAAASVLSLVLVSSAPGAVLGAVSNEQSHHLKRDAHAQHAGRVRRASASAPALSQKNGKRCKTRPGKSSSVAAPPKPTSTKAPAPKPTEKPAQNNGGGGSGGGSNVGGKGAGAPPSKKALAWSNGEDDHLDEYVNEGIKLYYNWQARPNPTAEKLDLEYAPMLWGTKNIDDFHNVAGKYKYLMGMNEVNLGAQADMSVSEGVKVWNQHIRPYGKQGKYLVAPSVTTAPDGVDWLEGFFNSCGGDKSEKCGVDALSIHYYGKDASDAIDYSTKLHNQFGLPVWISEFACQSFGGPDAGPCNSGQANAYIEGITSWALKTDWVHMIAPYGMMKNLGNVGGAAALMNANSGKPTSLGYKYINA